MKWIIFGGFILYYLYKAYLEAQAKEVEQAKKRRNTAPNNNNPIEKPKTFQELLKEIEDAMEGKTTPPPAQNTPAIPAKTLQVPAKRVIYEAKTDEDSIENHTIVLDSIEDGTIDKYTNTSEYVDKYEAFETGYAATPSSIPFLEIEDLKQNKTIRSKVLKFNGKKFSPKDLITAQIILERRY